ncbi:G-protein coupled receptor GRL101-like isoform X2 [Patiria miniata]|uniref:G-protein coupled receptors family 1 profile domain-containing protein n=1 Tax=Patiria miniata TaxID=46514 RepID=A0A913ZKV3_PATMI|nr:G-protein coupled receptor GRL101-like isoform X2 [Patiria miniata]
MRLTSILLVVFLISLFLASDARLRNKDETTSCENEADFECEPGVCIDASLACNSAYDCESMADETVMLCGCPSGEFRCLNSCIPLEKRCDRHCDCQDDCADEDHCDSFQCLPGFQKCENHFCMPTYAWCDFVDDCGDMSDEALCERLDCWYGQFQCINQQCINSFFLCDGIQDCTDGTDEMESTCSPGNFADCGDGTRVRAQQFCNGDAKCQLNKAVEINCDCSDDEFRCGNGKCLPPAKQCDRLCDCSNCEDEEGCDNKDDCDTDTHIFCPPVDGKPPVCLQKQFICDGRRDCPIFGWDEDDCQTLPDGESVASCNVPGTVSCGAGDPRCPPSKYVKCDKRFDCLTGVDEQNCTVMPCPPGQHQCRRGGYCVKEELWCDGYVDCFDGSDEDNCELFECPPGLRKCAAGQCISQRLFCDYHLDCFYYKNSTRDVSDEAHCTRRQCREDEFQCRSGQCIPASRRCYRDQHDHVQGCADLSHLRNCSDFVCPAGAFKCARSHCINGTMVCDKNVDCLESWDDEAPRHGDTCIQECASSGCGCSQFDMTCTNIGLNESSFSLNAKDTRLIIHFSLPGNNLHHLLQDPTALEGLTRTILLDLSDNGVTFINKAALLNVPNLQTLILADNKITKLGNQTFSSLQHLRTLILRGNAMQTVAGQAFLGLGELTTLDLSQQKIQSINKGAFDGLNKLAFLNLSHNRMTDIPRGTFFGLNELKELDISNNKLSQIHAEAFYGLPKLRVLHTDEFRFCCMVREMVSVETCTPPPDEFSSCEDLMANVFLRGSIWVIGIIASIGNLAVIMMRMNNKRDNRVHSFLITNLAIGDFCMGVYLLIIASVDAFYRGYYIIYDAQWRDSALCRFAGFLSTFSSELSVFSLTIITLHRLLSILFPFRIKDMEYSGAVRVMVVTWLMVIFLSAFPLFGLSYFGNFYGRSGVCLALHITPDLPKGWEYSVFIFLALNFISFLTIAVSYSVMFVVARRTQKAVNRSRDTNTGDAMARRMTLIVMTDFVCWVPIILLGVASLGGAKIPPQVYAWVAVFVLPVNSAINPMLYTLLTAPYVRRVMSRARTSLNLSLSTVTTDMKQVNHGDRQGRMCNGRKGWQKGIRLPKADANKNAIKLNTIISQSDTEPDEPATAQTRSEELNLLQDHHSPTQGAESGKEAEAGMHTGNV